MTKLRMCWRMPPVPWKEQNLDRQIAAFVAMGAEEREIITDKESGKSLDRPGYQALKNVILRKGDTLVVKSLDRLSRSKTDIRNELQFLKDKGIRLKVMLYSKLPAVIYIRVNKFFTEKLALSIDKC